MPEPSDWLARFAETLDRLGARWVVIGGVAALRYRDQPRFTTDIDFLSLPVGGVAEAFEAEGFRVGRMAEPGEEPYVYFVRGFTLKADILIAETPYQELAVERGLAGKVLTVEDVIVHKLLAGRPRDRDDITSILAAGHPLDVGYIEHWASEWEVLELWTELSARR